MEWMSSFDEHWDELEAMRSAYRASRAVPPLHHLLRLPLPPRRRYQQQRLPQELLPSQKLPRGRVAMNNLTQQGEPWPIRIAW